MKVKYPGWRTMTAAQRTNARHDRIWDEARNAQRFNAASREETNHASDCAHWVGEPCDCVTGKGIK